MLAAVKVLPEPVAIWMSARGRSARSDSSRLPIAVAWTAPQPRRRRAGASAWSRARNVGSRGLGEDLPGPLGQCLGPVEGEDATAAGVGVVAVGEPGLGSRSTRR